MLAAAVYPLKRLFVQKTNKPVLFGNLFHDFHSEHIGVDRNIARSEYRSHFVLRGSHLVMLSFG